MSQVIDRRLNGKNKSAVNRQRFIKRFKSKIKRAVSDAIAGRSITDVEKGENVRIPEKDISEPSFHHGRGGKTENIHPGNKEFIAGDRVKRPKQQGGKGGQKASNSGEGEDEFIFELSHDEFLQFFFEDLALPDLIKTKLAKLETKKTVRAGYATSGIPANINVIRSLKGAMGRRIALQSPYKKKIKEKEQQLQLELKRFGEYEPHIVALKDEIEALKKRARAIPYIDEFDLRYNNRIKQDVPTTQAVMFCLMDVSGSMDQTKKEISKRFFMLLYLFLNRNYEKIELVFIRHHTIAMEVDEENFFYSRETGGTVVSSALELMHEVITERYPSNDWNIYAAQASDGDNWNDDSPHCRELLTNSIMPLVQYYAYIEITTDVHQNLWHEYLNIKSAYPNFAMQRIEGIADIYPVFRTLFKKHKKHEA
ncbi:UPF0229 protein YeaH [hydrothermal vent metagenome]|uniref:UPF0229 protein YeaH n=1 Tax=hydrothermal vent metagenome TaxID=652676 RepID=A0A3B1A043_9ZZZZ